MRKAWRVIISSIFLCSLTSQAAQNVVVGVNAYGADLKDLEDNGVKTLRVSLFPTSIDFIIKAYQGGIGAVVIVYPFYGSKAKPEGFWGRVPLSKINPEEFRAGFKPMLDKLEAAGVRLTAMELDCEINTAGFDGDIASPGSKRVLGLADLNNAKDSEARVVADGYRVYLKVLGVLKDMRDHSKLNAHTPILSAGLAAVGPPSAKAANWNTGLAVSLSDAIEFLRENGLDNLVDGYGVHVYPDGDPHKAVAVRIASLGESIFAECTKSKPCWLTEWGVGNADQSCPVNDEGRKQAFAALRKAFEHFVSEGRLVAIIYYAWVGTPGKTTDSWAIFRCRGLTDAGKVALGPM